MSDPGRQRRDAAPTSRAPACSRRAPSRGLCLLLTLVVLLTGGLVICRRRTPRFELPRGNAFVVGNFGSPAEGGGDEAVPLVADCSLMADPTGRMSRIDSAPLQTAVDQAQCQHGAKIPTQCSHSCASVRLSAWSARL